MPELFQKIIFRVKKTRKETWILVAIILIGIFLRTWNFRDWLYFGADQARDADLSGRVLEGKDSWPLLGPDMSNTSYRLGPVYYWLQIISGKIFGNDPASFAYPDLLFSILAIPLLYYFAKQYFSEKISLAVSGIFAVSFFAVKYSRFAWNCNAIPFFSLLFLWSLAQFIFHKEKTSWKWIIVLGAAIGMGVQLHVLVLFLFPAVAFLSFIFLMIKNPRVFLRWMAVLVIFLVFNLPQIISETRTNFSNTRTFLVSFTDRSGSGSARLGENLAMDLDCHLQTNSHIISSFGEDEEKCSFSYFKIYDNLGRKKFFKKILTPLVSSRLIFELAFSLAGYFLLIRFFLREKEERKKIFLGLLIFYASLSFLVLILAIRGAPLRYFLAETVLPFIFLALILKFLEELKSKTASILAVALVAFLALSNLFSLGQVAIELNAGSRSAYNRVILGEIEPIADYIWEMSGGEKKVYLSGTRVFMTNFYRPLAYVSQKRGMELAKVRSADKTYPAGQGFDLLDGRKKNAPKDNPDCRRFGQMMVCKKRN